MTRTRAKLLSPKNFGAGGTFPRPISIMDTAATLTEPLLGKRIANTSTLRRRPPRP